MRDHADKLNLIERVSLYRVTVVSNERITTQARVAALATKGDKKDGIRNWTGAAVDSGHTIGHFNVGRGGIDAANGKDRILLWKGLHDLPL